MRLVIAIVLVLAGEARAELWVSSMGELMRDAASIEIMQVESEKDGVVTGKLVEAMRSKRAKGTQLTVALHGLAKPALGDRVLVICDRECPRAAGVVRDGWTHLRAQQPMDGAVVYPTVVVTSSIPALMVGKPAPNLCMRGTIALADEPARPTFEAQVSASDGRGTGTLDKMQVTARMGGASGFRDDDIGVSLGSAKISTETVKRQGACLVGELAPVGPIARTRRSLDRAVAGKSATQVIGRGKLVVGKGAKVAAGSHTLELSVDEHGQLILASKIASGTVNRIGYDDDKLALGFSIPSKEFYPTLELELVIGKGLAGGPAAQVVGVLAKKRAVPVKVTHTASLKSGTVTTPIGVMTLDYVPER
jgi:hypothetical protein